MQTVGKLQLESLEHVKSGEEVTSGVEKHKEIGTSLTNLLVEEQKSRETSSTLLTVVGMIMAVVTVALIILWISTDSLRVNLGVILLIIGICVLKLLELL